MARATIADILQEDLDGARGDIGLGRDRAAAAAARYIRRRLIQLERHFPNHRFVYLHRNHIPGLHCFPGCRGTTCVAAAARVYAWRFNRWPSLRGLHRVQSDLDAIGYRMINEFCRYLGRIDSATLPNHFAIAGEGVKADEAYGDALYLTSARAGDPGAVEQVRKIVGAGRVRLSANWREIIDS